MREAVHAVIMYALLIGVGTIILMPLSWMLTAALRGPGEVVYTVPVSWFPTKSFHFENFMTVLTYKGYPLWRPLANTLYLVVLNVLGVLISNTLVAYAFARLRFPGKEFLFRIVILTMLMPGIVLMVPSFLLFNALGWYGTYLPLWVPSFFANAWSIFITRQYMRSFPRDLDDAARIDGCGYFGIYRRIILPLCKPVMTVLAVFTFQGVWNDFTGPLIYLKDAEKFTLAIALDYFRRSAFSTVSVNTTNLVMAASLLSVIPMLVLYFAVQRQLIGGIASVGLKG
ncbi:MAG: carbohydrate ABC transporter permease [Meiothermus ruber]|uniref:carbohydrate ABC transporter permease n=1 Tax=Meiothermus ruber TaxID=277 RepID=UPI0023F6F34A|nr:carbohydrate ABC transporter permease [Meiothermus ruber]MCL6531514.1 carbohydrate ABC transporter permease [Meiothermus ruber]